MSLLYCYGVVGENVPIKQRGFENSTIYAIPFKGIFAVVSNVSKQEFSQEAIDTHVQDMQWLTQNAPLHESIVTNIMSQTTILPMKFCTIFEDKPHLEQMLAEKYADITYFLHNLKGKTEMSLKAYVNLPALREKVRQDAEIQQLEQEAAKKTPGQAYFIRQKAETLLKNKVQTRLKTEKQVVAGKIGPLTVEIKKNDVLTKKITGKGLEMAINFALLVKNDQQAILKEVVQELRGSVFEQMELTGPFAPYNFTR